MGHVLSSSISSWSLLHINTIGVILYCRFSFPTPSLYVAFTLGSKGTYFCFCQWVLLSDPPPPCERRVGPQEEEDRWGEASGEAWVEQEAGPRSGDWGPQNINLVLQVLSTPYVFISECLRPGAPTESAPVLGRILLLASRPRSQASKIHEIIFYKSNNFKPVLDSFYLPSFSVPLGLTQIMFTQVKLFSAVG